MAPSGSEEDPYVTVKSFLNKLEALWGEDHASIKISDVKVADGDSLSDRERYGMVAVATRGGVSYIYREPDTNRSHFYEDGGLDKPKESEDFRTELEGALRKRGLPVSRDGLDILVD